MPSSHLLDLHLLEAHDSFFAAQVGKRQKVFRCVVEVQLPVLYSDAVACLLQSLRFMYHSSFKVCLAGSI